MRILDANFVDHKPKLIGLNFMLTRSDFVVFQHFYSIATFYVLSAWLKTNEPTVWIASRKKGSF
jgi:hypothetical protein